jgi:hypothetical protein
VTAAPAVTPEPSGVAATAVPALTVRRRWVRWAPVVPVVMVVPVGAAV